MYYSERRAGQGMKRVAILVPWCPLCLGVPLMREAWCSDHGEGSLGSIKIHCEVSGEGHSPAVGTPKARRVNKDPPMKLHGKGLDITAITYCHYWPCLGKLYENGNEVERNEDSEKQRRETICFKKYKKMKKKYYPLWTCAVVFVHMIVFFPVWWTQSHSGLSGFSQWTGHRCRHSHISVHMGSIC